MDYEEPAQNEEVKQIFQQTGGKKREIKEKEKEKNKMDKRYQQMKFRERTVDEIKERYY